MGNCNKSLQKSLKWCEGSTSMPGIKRRLYYISKSYIVDWPTLPRSGSGRPLLAIYQGSFALAADKKWSYIDILPDKSQLTSEPQGEAPSQTQLNKLVAVHPGVGTEAALIAACVNNDDLVFLVEDQSGAFRVVGSKNWPTKATVNQDNGQGPTGNTSTTINVEATDEIPSPFYEGVIKLTDGEHVISPRYQGGLQDAIAHEYSDDDQPETMEPTTQPPSGN